MLWRAFPDTTPLEVRRAVKRKNQKGVTIKKRMKVESPSQELNTEQKTYINEILDKKQCQSNYGLGRSAIFHEFLSLDEKSENQGKALNILQKSNIPE